MSASTYIHLATRHIKRWLARCAIAPDQPIHPGTFQAALDHLRECGDCCNHLGVLIQATNATTLVALAEHALPGFPSKAPDDQQLAYYVTLQSAGFPVTLPHEIISIIEHTKRCPLCQAILDTLASQDIMPLTSLRLPIRWIGDGIVNRVLDPPLNIVARPVAIGVSHPALSPTTNIAHSAFRAFRAKSQSMMTNVPLGSSSTISIDLVEGSATLWLRLTIDLRAQVSNIVGRLTVRRASKSDAAGQPVSSLLMKLAQTGNTVLLYQCLTNDLGQILFSLTASGSYYLRIADGMAIWEIPLNLNAVWGTTPQSY